MKKLNLTHLVSVSRLLRKTNLKNQIKNLRKANTVTKEMTEEEKQDTFFNATLDLIFSLLDALAIDGNDQELYNLLDDIFEADTPSSDSVSLRLRP